MRLLIFFKCEKKTHFKVYRITKMYEKSLPAGPLCLFGLQQYPATSIVLYPDEGLFGRTNQQLIVVQETANGVYHRTGRRLVHLPFLTREVAKYKSSVCILNQLTF